ncbi:DNA repair protein UVH3 [Quillaja saponaria]|uniref:DNA repair protein UVH3 n=1 Tax=Quillaja saponaria TaxID=32244 RepID=A0AAD7Q448_QUISA|nr:DNA repair protein UVH3 [Quillaja saponaria]
MQDVEKELGLTREKLIHTALLLGSDYTEGVSGIGIVNAIEVVNAFPEEDGLLKFREWVESPDPTILGKFDAKTGSSAKKKGLVVDGTMNSLNGNMGDDQNISCTKEQKQSASYIKETKQNFMDKHRNVSKNWHIPSAFPSEAVIAAYTSPQVDKSTDPVTWGKPDRLVLRKLCWEKFGWTGQKADELLLPVLKEYNKHETQLRLEAFYTFNERFAKIRSKRIKKALKGITGNQSLHLMDDSAQEIEESRKRRISSPGEPGDSKSEALNAREHNPVGTEKSNKKQSRKREDVDATTPSRKKRNTGDSTSSELKILEPHILEDGQQCVSKGLGGKGKGRNISRGRAGGVQRGRGRRSAGFEPCQTTSSDSDNDEDAWGLHVENLKGPQRMRRSMRSRKPVNYIMDDLEIGDTGDTNNSLDQSYKTCVNEEAREQELSSAKGVSVDAVTGSGWKIKGIVEDLSLEEDLCGDNRESGGFCTPDDGEPGVSHFGNPSSGNESPTNFLKMGGGFCLDNSEFDDSHGGDSSPPTATGENNADHPHSSDLVDEADDNCKDLIIFRHKRTVNEPPDRGKTITLATEPNLDHLNHISNHDQSNTGVLLENANDALGTTTEALSAMPFLRRKRKRNS